MQAVTTSRQSIHKLSQQLANQIAAGEVVERPASVVKELLENSLDAGATQIDIDIQAGGTQAIRIRDNGYGIPKDELQLALSPHATSKIHCLDDLIHVASMGFRGEALASIASVSELTLTSLHDEMAWSIKSREDLFDLTPASHPPGTTVEVNNLFYNTPARRKFLRSDRTEYRHVEDVVKRIALARFDVAFNFRHNQRQIFSLPAAKSNENKVQRLKRLINKEFIQSAVELNFQSNGENAGLKLSGWLATAEYSRSQSDMQYFFVNGRMIRDKVITHAVRQAFQQTLYPGRFPVYVLNLELDAEQVDVNVHPTKHEVRFRQARLIHDFLFHSLQQALKQENHTQLDNPGNSFSQPCSLPNRFTKEAYPASSNSGFNTAVAESYSSSAYHVQAKNEGLENPLGVAIAKLQNDYLVAQNQQGLLVVLLPLARKKLIQKQIETRLSAQKTLISKPVLMPFSVSININAECWLQQNKNVLQQLGFEFAEFGEKEIMVRQVPAMLNARDLKQAIHQFVEIVQKSNKSELSFVTDGLLEIMINDDFSNSPDDWNKLLRDLELHDDMSALYYQISENDLAKWFN